VSPGNYAPLATARLKGASDKLAGRFNGWAPPENVASDDDPLSTLTQAAGVH